MMLVAAVALTLVISPGLMNVIMQPISGWDYWEKLAYKIDLALIFWTSILSLNLVIASRRRIQRVCCSYGSSAVIAASVSVLILLARGLWSALLGYYFRGSRIFPYPDLYYSPTAKQLVIEAPEAAAAAIFAAWSILALTGSGRRPSDWLDRVGFLFGLIWVLWYVVGRDLTLHLRWL
jgi:hypothetical protein